MLQATALCLCVYLSHAGVLSERLNTSAVYKNERVSATVTLEMTEV